jgi:glycosyltransferase involved in cell wall biosynthesis
MEYTSPKIAIVIPCYNEESALPISASALLKLLDSMVADKLIDSDSFILCCDDGSKDRTWHIINELHKSDSRIKGISLAHNRGHQNVLIAGLMTVHDKCDAAISIDADLQDDINAIVKMVKLFRSGKEIVYGVRRSRRTDSWFKRNSAHAFYKFQKLMGLETIYDHADYRLMSSRALSLLGEYNEANLFLRGIIPQIGLETAIVTYDRDKRVAGESKYPLKKMIALSIDGITSFSAKPMKIIFIVGFIFLILDILIAIWVFSAYFNNSAIIGWSSLMLSVWFLGSLILMGIGIIGEYIGKIYIEVKRRPRFAIKEFLL